MKLSNISRGSVVVVVSSMLACAAQAHPGHDGGHDLTWDYAPVDATHYLTSPYHWAVTAAVATVAFFAVRGLVRWLNKASTKNEQKRRA